MAKKSKKKIKRRPWSKEDVRELKTLARQKVSAASIAKQFKRSVPALRQKAMNLGISLDSRGSRKRKA
jgi:polysaccharide deacetylase 2 family uncharacterized protein YibQ